MNTMDNASAVIKQQFGVDHSYSLYFTEKLFHTQNTLFRDLILGYKPDGATKILFVVDSEVARLHPQLESDARAYCAHFAETLQYVGQLVVPGGETSKNGSEQVERVLQAINDGHICRHSFVVAIGGGAVIDMTGYAATIAHRGVQLIRVPTTVLSQNDAAVGVKNGINAFGKKNFLGTFSLPYAIINDAVFLETLEQRDWISGVAEAVKVALIKDAAFFDIIEENALALANRDMPAMYQLIHRCAEIHMQHIAQGGDPFEKGSARPLDFGHWAAHKMEHMSQYSIRHGEAVAMGIALDVTYAHLIGSIDRQTLEQIWKVLQTIGFSIQIPFSTKADIAELLGGIEEFREHLGGKLTITLIQGIGKGYNVHQIDMGLMEQAVHMLNEFVSIQAQA